MNTVIEFENLPISRYNTKTKEWEFVEIFYGSYDAAMSHMRDLQGERDALWQYRIWDCR